MRLPSLTSRSLSARSLAVRAAAVTTGVAVLLTGGAFAAGDAAAATGTVISGSIPLKIRSAPNTSSSVVGQLTNGNKITIECQTTGTAVTGPYGTSTLWNRIPGRGYVADAWVYTGSNSRVAPNCGAGQAPAPRSAPQSTSGRQRGATSASNPLHAYRGYCTWGAQEKIRAAMGSYASALIGNAGQWYGQARAAGWSVTLDAQPRSVAVFSSSLVGGVGHVAWVDRVENRADGRYVHLTEMNFGPGATAGNGYRTRNFGVWSTRVTKDVPGMSYILIP
ncbi:MAG: CHAP domain-containing protein [Gordonia sp. (in: high G+C Gram-positive bacteria)]|uniref:CHAP domain-containing protein n=1 Tax=Gordonia sp. (in: high G+C Gram-positive bacteria) TaxID=84139 RepID=UPI0039E321DF